MFNRNLGKFFLLILAFSLCTASCKYFANFGGSTKRPDVPVGETESDIPFSNKEPGIYQAEIVTASFENGEKTERKVFVARSAEKHLAIYDQGTPHEISYLRQGGQTFAIYPAKKVFAEISGVTGTIPDQSETLNDFLTSNWLNDKTSATYENLGMESGLTKYHVKLDNAESASEAYIYIDEKAGIPIKQEFYSLEDGVKSLLFSSEIKDLKLQTDDKLFEIPQSFQKISAKEFHAITWQDKQ